MLPPLEIREHLYEGDREWWLYDQHNAPIAEVFSKPHAELIAQLVNHYGQPGELWSLLSVLRQPLGENA